MALQALCGNGRGNFRGDYRGRFQAQQNYRPPQDFTQYPAVIQAPQFEQMGEPKCGKCGLNRHLNVVYCPAANAQCLFCGRTGHYRRCCRLAKMESRGRASSTRGGRRDVCATNLDETSHQYIVIRVKKRNLQCLVDSGSSKSIINAQLAHNLGLKLEPMTNDNFLIVASGQKLSVIGKVNITIHIKCLVIVHTFSVVRDLFPSFLIDDDFLRKNSAMINYMNSTVTFYDGLIVLPLQGFQSMNRLIVHVFIERSVSLVSRKVAS